VSLAVRARLRGDVSTAINWYRRLVEYDPVSTSSVLGLMLTFVAASEPLEALKHYQQHAKLLREEFDAKPSEKIELAAERIRQDLSYRMSGSAPSTALEKSVDVDELPSMFSDSPIVARRTSGPTILPGRISGPTRLFGRNSGPAIGPARTSGPTKLPAPPSQPS
jgi:DNA-binding SARP family transcriptional activator